MEEALKLTICPKCIGCSNQRCLHLGATMVTFRAEQLVGYPLNKCNTKVKYPSLKPLQNHLKKIRNLKSIGELIDG